MIAPDVVVLNATLLYDTEDASTLNRVLDVPASTPVPVLRLLLIEELVITKFGLPLPLLAIPLVETLKIRVFATIPVNCPVGAREMPVAVFVMYVFET